VLIYAWDIGILSGQYRQETPPSAEISGGSDMSDSGSGISLPIVVLDITKEVEPGQVNAAIAEIWSEIQEDPKAREAALKAGLDESAIERSEPPLFANVDRSNIGVPETIAIFVGLEASKALIHQAVKTAWESQFWSNYLWPRVRARFGAKLRPRN
jgi:hypothetical protein